MLVINTIAEFLALPMNAQNEILRSIRAKDRLDNFLNGLNNPKKIEPHWVACKHCDAGKCKKCDPTFPGWHWLSPHVRDNSDIHPSQIDKCLKYLVLCCSGYADYHEERIDPRLRRIFDMGTVWGMQIQHYGKKGAWGDPADYQDEAPIDPDAAAFDGTPILPVAAEHWIKGAADALLHRYFIECPTLGTVCLRIVHEYKTINSNGFDKLTRPKPEHKKQATIYAAVFNAPVVVYIYTNKDNCNLADFPVAFDYTIWNEIVQKVQRVQSYVTNNAVPPWEETAVAHSPTDCAHCPLKRVCQPPTLRRDA